jgi:hypothetical protein
MIVGRRHHGDRFAVDQLPGVHCGVAGVPGEELSDRHSVRRRFEQGDHAAGSHDAGVTVTSIDGVLESRIESRA